MTPLPKLDLAQVALPLALHAMPFPADRALAERWRAALGGDCPASADLIERGILPPQALTANTIFLAFRNYHLEGGVYAREQVTYRRPVRLGEVLSISGEIAATYLHKGRRFRIMRSVSRDAAGGIVVESRSTGVAQLALTAGAEATEVPPDVPAPGPYQSAGAVNPCRARLGATVPGEARLGHPSTITLAMMRAQAGDDDRNPIHTDEGAARRAGLAAPIAGGPHVLEFVQEVMMQWLGDEALLHGAHFDVRWLRPVAAGASIVPAAVIETVDVVSGAVTIAVRVDCGGAPAMVGAACLPV